MICATSSVQKVRLLRCPSIRVPTKTNSRERDTPVTISGLVMGILVRFMASLRILGFRPLMPTAATVPKAVATKLASTDTIRELRSSSSRLSSSNSRTYCFRVKPSKCVMFLPVLKDATTSTAMGIYRKMKMRMVINRLVRFIPSRPLPPRHRRSDS